MRAHFECPVCLTLYNIEYTLADTKGPNWPPACGGTEAFRECLGTLILAPQPGDYKFDLRTDGEGRGTSQKYTVHRQVPAKNGSLVQVAEEISSLHQIRKIEKDSETRYANGEGEPLRFRAFSQDRSNSDVQGFGKAGTIGGRAYDSGQTPKKNPKITTRRHGQGQPAIKTHRIGGISPL